jgi:hypothetical protein
MSHTHHFKSWTFQVPVETGTFTTRQVLDGSCPILEVYHDHDGEWQFLCGTTLDTADLKLVCLGCMVERDDTLLELAGLPIGWTAYRDSTNRSWQREPYQRSQ